MPFTGNENHKISLTDAAELTANFRKTIKPGSIIGGFFGAATLKKIIEQPNCVGIRYYYGLNATGAPVLVLVGADANENDLVTGELAEISLPCPNWCSTPNKLNSDI